MKLRVELRRVGSSRVSEDCIPIVARIVQGETYGGNMLDGERWIDIDGTKAEIQRRIVAKFRGSVDVEFIDRTRD